MAECKDKNKENKISQEEIWDKISEQWNEFRKTPMPEVLDFLKNKKGKILDLGCGSGRHFIKSKNIEIYGVDFSQEMLNLAKQKNISKELKKSSTEKIPYPDNFFDAAIFINTIHCIFTKKKREKSLKELFRVLKQNSEALVTAWNRNQERIKNKPKETTIPWSVNGKKYQRDIYIYDKDELETLLKKQGFKVLKTWEDRNTYIIVQKP